MARCATMGGAVPSHLTAELKLLLGRSEPGGDAGDVV